MLDGGRTASPGVVGKPDFEGFHAEDRGDVEFAFFHAGFEVRAASGEGGDGLRVFRCLRFDFQRVTDERDAFVGGDVQGVVLEIKADAGVLPEGTDFFGVARVEK